MKANVLLFCMCACLFTQCNRAGDELTIPEPKEEVAAEETQKPEEIPADEPPQTPETPKVPEIWDYDDPNEWTDVFYDRFYEKAVCLSPAKTGESDDIVGKWKLILEINKGDTTDRSCEDIVYHFREDSTLTASGDAEEVGIAYGTLTVSGDVEKEDMAYEYVPYPCCPACLPRNPQPNLSMGDTNVFCQVLLTKMILYPRFMETGFGSKFPVGETKTLFLRIE
jgi:hypothetical protein